ncbi:MAG: acyl-homoserine-lactone synthase [Alphaproteobacteria bacterium]
MQTTTLSFQNIHDHGVLFTNLLKARRETFIVQRKWDLPEVDGMEFDQYDTPQSRWIAVHDGATVLAGIRLTPTTARCGIYSYMIRDAQRGLLETIPPNLLYEAAPVSPLVCETSRVFVSREVGAEIRSKVQRDLMLEMVASARALGAERLIGLCPSIWGRWMRRIGFQTESIGPVLDIGGVPNQCIAMNCPQVLH